MSAREEIEPELVTSRPILFGDDGIDAGMHHAIELDDRQHALARAIRHDHRADLDAVVAAILAQRTKRHVVPLWVLGNGAVDANTGNRKLLSQFPASGQWILEQIVAWADPAASANLQVNLTLDATVPIPIPLGLSKTAIVTTPIELPVTDNDTAVWATSGGTVNDRGAVLLIFKREG